MKPLPSFRSNTETLTNMPFFSLMRSTSFLNQGPTLSPSVFNFYDNNFVPADNYFRNNAIKAPEIQIQNDSFFSKYNNRYEFILFAYEKTRILDSNVRKCNGSPCSSLEEFGLSLALTQEKFYIDAKGAYDALEFSLDGDTNGDFKNFNIPFGTNGDINSTKALGALVDYLDNLLIGKQMSSSEKQYYIDTFSVEIRGLKSKSQMYIFIIEPLIQSILISDSYMTQ
jgi:hypothetical protein